MILEKEFWVEKAKPKLLGHSFAQKIANNHYIDTADMVEPVESLSSADGFSGNILIEERKNALVEARKYQAETVLKFN